jgi:hypothetical protein
MGTLDEAIREHLELKRRRGATDSELQRLEDEAFGPPSRPGEPDFPEHAAASPEQSGNGAVAEAQGEPPEPEVAEAETAIYDENLGAQPELGEVELDEVKAAADEAPAPSEPTDLAPSVPPIETLDTVEHEVPEQEPGEPVEREEASAEEEEDQQDDTPGEEGSAEEEADQQDDMLADTPEFLRDAPEDDELWFEQGKPKDFDF